MHALNVFIFLSLRFFFYLICQPNVWRTELMIDAIYMRS